MALMKNRKAMLVYLETNTHRRVGHAAQDQRMSMSELVRKAIDEYLERHPPEPRIRPLTPCKKSIPRLPLPDARKAVRR
jgi:hypothetical protein